MDGGQSQLSAQSSSAKAGVRRGDKGRIEFDAHAGTYFGRLVVFFPGQFEQNNYRLLDARDGWNYLAVPITLYGEGSPA